VSANDYSAIVGPEAVEPVWGNDGLDSTNIVDNGFPADAYDSAPAIDSSATDDPWSAALGGFRRWASGFPILMPLGCFALGCLCCLMLVSFTLPSLAHRQSMELLREYHAHFHNDSRIIVIQSPATATRLRGAYGDVLMSPHPDRDSTAATRPLRRGQQTVLEQGDAVTRGVGDCQSAADNQEKAVLTHIFKQNIELRERMMGM
jgi:hypothetical protein